MAAINKIEKYQLQERTLELSGEGKTTHEIAQVLTRELGGQDRVSQPTVSRWLKKKHVERRQIARVIVDDYIQESLPNDLKILDELSTFHLGIFRGTFLQTLETRLNTQIQRMDELMGRRVMKMDEVREIKEILEGLQQQVESTQKDLTLDLKTRMSAGDRLHRIVETKLRFVGVPDGDEEAGGRLSPEEREELKEFSAEFAKMKMGQQRDDTGTQVENG